MNWLDLMLLLIIGLSFASGLMKGLVREVLSLVGVVVAIVAAILLAPGLAAPLERWLPPTAAYAAGLLLVFLLVMVAVEILARLLTRLVKFVRLGAANHLLGGAFGVLRGGLIGVILVLGLLLFLDAGAPVLVESRVTPVLGWGARVLAEALPEDLRHALDSRVDELERARGAQTI